MKIRRHYLALRAIYPHIGEREPLEVTTQELAEALDCTHRNMVLLLQRMQRENWIGWEPKRGRGNRSILRFLAGKEELLLAEAQDIAERQDLQRAVSYLQEMDDDGGALRSRFQAWLSGRFGFQSEVRGERRLDLLRFPLPQHIHSLDPADMHYAGESHLVNQLFDGLVRMSPGGEAALPHLAHAWEVDGSRRRWTFFLRKGVLFHNGREMTAADVRFSFERLKRLAPKGLFHWVYGEIDGIETPNERTVTFRLRAPNELFLPFLTTNRASIVPAADELLEGALFGLHPIGTGPFRLAGSEHGIFTLEAFDAYFRGRGFLDVVEVWTEPGSARGGDESEGLPVFEVMHNVRLSGPASQRLQQVRQSGMTCKFVTVNELRDGPLRDPAIRQAFDAAVNRASLIERLSGDVIEAADSFWPDLHRGVPHGIETRAMGSDQPPRDNAGQFGAEHGADLHRVGLHGANLHGAELPGAKLHEADLHGAELHGTELHEADLYGTPLPGSASCGPPTASELLASAGYAGERIVLATIPQYKADAELVRDECAASGIRLDIELIPAEIFKGESRLAADLLLFAVMLDEHRELRLIELFKSMLHHLLPETQRDMERRIDALLALRGAEERTGALLAIEDELRSTQRLLFLYRKHLKTAFHPSIRGISLESLGWVRFRDLWFKPEELANG